MASLNVVVEAKLKQEKTKGSAAGTVAEKSSLQQQPGTTWNFLEDDVEKIKSGIVPTGVKVPEALPEGDENEAEIEGSVNAFVRGGSGGGGAARALGGRILTLSLFSRIPLRCSCRTFLRSLAARAGRALGSGRAHPPRATFLLCDLTFIGYLTTSPRGLPRCSRRPCPWTP